MALFHFDVRQTKRSAGQSAIACAAYRSGQKLYSDYYGEWSDYSRKDGFDWYLRFNGDPDKPLRCKLEGKRKTTTRISISGANSPAADESATGCDQGLRNTLISCNANPQLLFAVGDFCS